MKFKIKRLNEVKGSTVFGAKLTEEELNKLINDINTLDEVDFYKEYLFYAENIIALGDVLDVNKAILDEVIIATPSKRADNGKIYTCFGKHMNERNKAGTIIIHEDPRSSWQCLLEYMKYPTYLVLLKNLNDELSKTI